MADEKDVQGVEVTEADEVRVEAAAKAAEELRITQIEGLCAQYANRFNNTSSETLAEIKAKAIREGLDLKATKMALFAGMLPDPPRGVWNPGNRSSVLDRDVLAAGFMVRAGMAEAAAKMFSPDAVEVAEHSFSHSMDICKAALMMDHVDLPHGPQQMVKAAFSSMSMPSALGAAGEKVMLDAYRNAPSPWRLFASIQSVSSFREHTAIRPSFLGSLSEVGPGGELKHGSINESTFAIRAATYGKILRISRQDVINDDAGAFLQIAQTLGAQAARSLNDLVAETLLALTNDMTGANSALSGTSLATAVATLRNAKDSENNCIKRVAPYISSRFKGAGDIL